MRMLDQEFASTLDHRPGIVTDPGDAWGSRADGGIAPVFDYMDEEIEEAMIPIGMSEASPGVRFSVEGQTDSD